MKLWIDDVRPAPEGYIVCKSVNSAKKIFLRNIPVATAHVAGDDLTGCSAILSILSEHAPMTRVLA